MNKLKNIPPEWKNLINIPADNTDNTEHLNVYDEKTIGITKHLNGYDENTEHKAESVANGCLAPDQAGSEHNFSRPC